MQGKAVVQAPAVDPNVSPLGVASATLTLAASDGPGFVTTIVYTRLVPGTTFGGPVLVMPRSAEAAPSVVEAEAVLLAGAGSVVVADTDAVLTIGLGPAYPDGTW